MKNKRITIPAVCIVFLAVISLFVWLYINNITFEEPTALIYKNGKITNRIELFNITDDYEIIITGDSGESNTILVRNGEIGITSASCPDHVCINTGFIGNGIVPIVCLPNKLEIRVQENVPNDIDIILY